MTHSIDCRRRSAHRLSRACVAVAAALFGVGVLAPVASAQLADPTPPRFPQPSAERPEWELRIRHGTPKRIVVKHANIETPTAYWYMTYTAVNPGPKEVVFAPDFQMLAADGKLHRGNVGIPQDVFEAIKEKEGNRYLSSHAEIFGRVILPGEEQAKDGVAIFVEPVRRMETFSIFLGGFSSDEQTMLRKDGRWTPVNRATAVKDLEGVKDEDKYTLRKQFMVTYKVRGDDVLPGIDPIDQRFERWVMRP